MIHISCSKKNLLDEKYHYALAYRERKQILPFSLRLEINTLCRLFGLIITFAEVIKILFSRTNKLHQGFGMWLLFAA